MTQTEWCAATLDLEMRLQIRGLIYFPGDNVGVK